MLEKGKGVRWADVFATLIHAGHDVANLRTYTRRQLMLYFDAVGRMDKRRRRLALIDQTNVMAGGNELTALFNQLSQP